MKERIENLRKLYPSIKDVIKASNVSENEQILLDYNGTSNRLIGAKAFMLLEMVAELFNTRADGSKWEADWNDDNQRKWFPVFNMQSKTPSGVGFSDSIYDFCYSFTYCGSRLAFEFEELTDLSAELYPEVYIDVLTKNKK